MKKLGGKLGEDVIRKYCVNERGDVFLHPDKSKEFGFDLGFDYSLKDIAPEMVEEVKSMDYCTKHDKEHHHVDSFKKLFFDPLNKIRYWAVIYEIPDYCAFEDIGKTRNVMLIVGIVIIVCSVIIITLFVSKKIVRPIIMIANAAKKMDEGDLSVRLPTGKTGNEFGMIYHAMNAFAESQQNSIERFEKEIAARTCELEKRANYERSFGETISFFNTTYNLKSALNQTLTPLAARHPFPVSAIYIYDEWSGIFQCMASHGATKTLKTEFALGEGIVGQAAMAHHTKITLDVDKDIGIVLVDTRKFKQSVYNLLSNAVKFTPDGGDVSIKARKTKSGIDGDLIEISVADTRIGISQENISKLFSPIEQLDGSVSRKYGGTGLGLSMVKRLVELHGGTVEVTSEPGKGTCFTIKLPYRTEDEKTPLTEVTPIVDERSVTSVIGLSKVKSPLVLIIEDDNTDASLIRIQLENEGYRTVRASTGQQGLEMVHSYMPDLVTLDIILPDMSGLEFLSMTKQDKNLENISLLLLFLLLPMRKKASPLVRQQFSKNL